MSLERIYFRWLPIAILTLYLGTFVGLKVRALRWSREYGLKGYYFLPPYEDNEELEYKIRAIFFPLILIDHYLITGDGPAAPPLRRFSVPKSTLSTEDSE